MEWERSHLRAFRVLAQRVLKAPKKSPAILQHAAVKPRACHLPGSHETTEMGKAAFRYVPPTRGRTPRSNPRPATPPGFSDHHHDCDAYNRDRRLHELPLRPARRAARKQPRVCSKVGADVS